MSINNIQAQNIFNVNNVQTSKSTPLNNTTSVNSVFASDTMQTIAHRGYSELAPENTLAAFEKAAEYGFDTVECDISWTKDNVPVLLHDETINRTARKENGAKLWFPRKCSKLTYEELLKYDFGSYKGEEFKGTKIPTLSEALECADENDLNLYLELKATDDFDDTKAQILADAVIEAGLEDKVTWISFDENALKKMSEIMPASRLGYLSKVKPTEDTIKTLESLKTGENEVFLDIKASKMSDEADNLLDEAGFDFEAWTVDDLSTVDNLKEYDCLAITTNSLTENDIEEYFEV